MNWSPAKERLFRFAADTVVSASAGSGKTAALVELYLRLLAGRTDLAHPLAVEEVVAITFTDKAAVEMKERIRLGIRKRIDDGDATIDWKRALRSLSVAPISTFHTFCSRLLREHPAEAGIDPSFTLLDDSAEKGLWLAVIEEVLDDELRSRSPEIALLVRHFQLFGTGRGKGIGEYLRLLAGRIAACEKDTDALSACDNRWQAEAGRLFAAGCAELPQLLGEVPRILGGKELAFHRSLRNLPGIYHDGRLAVDDPDTLTRLTAMAACVGGNWGKESGVKERLDECLTALQLACRQRQSCALTSAFIALAGKLAAAYRQRKAAQGVLDFEDLLVKSRDLLGRHPDLRAGMQRRFSVIMVDEFQDTNTVQKELVDLLLGPGQRLFLVGDPKQSIYLFRGADVTVFTKARDNVCASGGQTLYFQESFRSREGIVTFVNRLFEQVMQTGDSPFEVTYEDGDHLLPERQDWDDAPCVELITLPEGGDGEARRYREAAAIAARVTRLCAGDDGVRVFDKETIEDGIETRTRYVPRLPRYGDVAILFRRFSNLKLFEKALRSEGIPYYVVKGRGFYHCQEVLDIANFLRYLECGSDGKALTALLRSPFCGVSDETLYLMSRADGGICAWDRLTARRSSEQDNPHCWSMIDAGDQRRLTSLQALLSRLRPLKDRLTLAELLEEMLTGTDFASALFTTFQGTQKVANVRKLIEISRSFSGTGEGALRRFASLLTDLTEAEPTEAEAVVAAEGENVVRLMTIHQSKGLEFPIVLLPELGATLPGETSAVVFDDEFGVGAKLPLADGGWGSTLATDAIVKLRREKESAELKRLFYVAATRARDYLIFSGEGRGEFRRWIDAFATGEHAHLLRVTAGVATGTEEIGSTAPPDVSAPAPGGAGGQMTSAMARVLGYTPSLPEMMVFSPTALEDFRHCPRKYFYRSVMGLDEGLFSDLLGNPALRGMPGHGMRALEKGNLAHAMLEGIDFGAPPTEQRTFCRHLARRLCPRGSEADLHEVSAAVMHFASSATGRSLSGKVLLREHPFVLKLRGEGNYHLQGAMDLVAIDEDRATVYDYKYVAPENADLEGYRFQVCTYMMALSKFWPERQTNGSLLFLKGGEQRVIECDLERFEAEVVALMDSARQRHTESDFSLRDDCTGHHCPFRHRCGR
jgi:ATP-dependent helicase/nuclease subunit A